MTDQGLQFPRFYVTAPSACPYLDGQTERKVFTELNGSDASALNEALGRVGFRRSQSVVYRPACESCSACISVRVRALEHSPSKSERRVLKTNSDIKIEILPAKVSEEQYDLLQEYLTVRHGDGSMASMTMAEYAEMVETSPVNTLLIEYRRVIDNKLLAVALSDELSDGLSMVYSFFVTDEPQRSLGTYIILDHIARAQANNSPYVYLGYWVKNSSKMDYKRRFKPLDRLGQNGWFDMHENDPSRSA